MADDLGSIKAFYAAMTRLVSGLAGGRLIEQCAKSDGWPKRGVYFLFEPGEQAASPLTGPRVVRVGTHALNTGSKTCLWDRLYNHRGNHRGSGNHRCSIFRVHVGRALMQRYPDRFEIDTWGKKPLAMGNHRQAEEKLERAVSEYIGSMTMLWLSVPDDAGPSSDRSLIERSAIGLLSGWHEQQASHTWLGNDCPNPSIRVSRLWNVNHINDAVDKRFLTVLERYVDATITSHAL